MRKRLKITIAIVLIIIIAFIALLAFTADKPELGTVKSNKELLKIYDGENEPLDNVFVRILTLPFSMWAYGYTPIYDIGITKSEMTNEGMLSVDSSQSIPKSGTSSKDYSTTNIQVENVDEADITKTDGDYIYSISGTDVVITDVREPENIKIASRLQFGNNSIPNDMILYKNELVVIGTKIEGTSTYSSNNSTTVNIYDITNKERPSRIKDYELYEPYYTSRCTRKHAICNIFRKLKKRR